jgi:beta-N-acetylhexosaminidase
MTGHLLVPAWDPELPATLSPRILTGLLREELGFDGLIVTDGIEMQGVRRRYGLEGATVRAIAAGVDAICVGGDHADEQTAIRLRDAIVAAVHSGQIPEERLHDAVRRVRALAAWTTRTQIATGARVIADAAAGTEVAVLSSTAGSGAEVAVLSSTAGSGAEVAVLSSTAGSAAGRRDVAVGSTVGFAAARRAVRITSRPEGPSLPVTGVPHVVEFAPPRNIAIGSETPWGVGDPLSELLPGTTAVRFEADDLESLADPWAPVLAAAGERPLVLVVRDVHRHPWIERTLRGVLAVRPDAIVVEMGIPVTVTGGVHIATHGATRALGQAAAEIIAGADASEPTPQPVAA